MQVQDVMTRRVVMIPSTATVKTAAATMKVLRLGALPVRDVDRIVGMVTDRDIAIQSVAAGYKPRKLTVERIMTLNVAYCFTDDSLDRAQEIMAERHVRRLVVVDRQYKLAGILGLVDLVVRGRQAEMAGQTLGAIARDESGRSRRPPRVSASGNITAASAA